MTEPEAVAAVQHETISREVQKAIRREAVEQTAKWVIGVIASLILFALIGWWFFLEPKIRDYIVNAAGGVPSGAILASIETCDALPGKWKPFEEGTGRFLIGAGDQEHSAYKMWHMVMPDGAERRVQITHYKLFDQGGQEKIKLAAENIPPHSHGLRRGNKNADDDAYPLYRGTATTDTGDQSAVSTDVFGQGKEFGSLPPFVAVYYCTKE